MLTAGAHAFVVSINGGNTTRAAVARSAEISPLFNRRMTLLDTYGLQREHPQVTHGFEHALRVSMGPTGTASAHVCFYTFDDITP